MGKKVKKSPQAKVDKRQEAALKAASVGATFLTAAVTKKALDAGWRATTGKKPPSNPGSPEVAVREAVIWAALSSMVIAVVRILVTRKTADYFAKSAWAPDSQGTTGTEKAADAGKAAQAVSEAAIS